MGAQMTASRAPSLRRPPADGAQTRRRTGTTGEWITGFLLAIWIGVLSVLLARGGLAELHGAVLVAVLVILLLPLAALAVALLALRRMRALDDQLAALQDSFDGLRLAWQAQALARTRSDPATAPDPRQAVIDGARRATESAGAVFASARSPRSAAAAGDGADAVAQPALALGPEPRAAVGAPPEQHDLIRALHFPEDADDREGFAALQRALSHHATGRLIRSAQEVLTGLAEEGIFMDDLRPDRARPELWRAFAGGLRGPAVAGLAGVRDRSSLALAVGRMRQDPAFREAAHRFLREFDRCLTDAAPAMDDAALARLTDTRSARAFMLLGRVTGAFGR